MLKPIHLFASATALALAVLVIAGGRAAAQTITGTVRGATGPVSGATVRLLELDRTERTDTGGKFSFAGVPKGTYRIFAGAVGYATHTDTIRVAEMTTNVSFNLRQSPFPLKEIVVSASPAARPINEQYQATQSKSRTEFDNSPGTSFAEKISDLPGVTVRGNGSAPSRPILRGLGDNEVLILENGLRMGDIATYDPAHATPIDAMSIDQIDVVRGPATILYGPSAIGGLVNVITNLVPTVSNRPLSGTVAVEGNTVSDNYSGYVNGVLSSGNSAFRVSAGGLHSSDIRIPSGSYTDPASGATFNLDRLPQTFDHSSEAGLGYSYQGRFGMIGIGGNHYQMNYGIPGVPPNADWLTVPPTTSRISQQRNTVELRALVNTAGSLANQVRIQASYNDYGHSEFPTAEDSSGVSDPQANHFHKRELNAVLQLQQHRAGRLTGTVGLWTDIQNLTIEGDQPLGPNSVTTGLAAYAYEEYLAAPGTRLQGAVRYDYNQIQTNPFAQSTDPAFQTLDVSRQSNAVTASVGGIRQFSPEVSGSFSIARSFRAPTVQELFANGLDAASGTYSIGTAALAPETGLGIDASLRGNFGHATFELSPYLNSINHYIFGFLRGDTIDAFPVRQFSATRARLAGFEASASVAATPNLVLRASSDYVNAQDTGNGVPLPFIPPLRGLLRATYQDQRYSGMVEWRMAASQTRLGDGDTPTDGYGIMNLGAGIRIAQRGVMSEISLHVDNLFNRVYRDNLSVIKDFLPQPGRGIRLNYQLLY
ncbi:MAG: TonB-dependent receptor [Gemmatimonadales bacterium]